MFIDKLNLEDLTHEDLDNYIVEITADNSKLEAYSNRLFDMARRDKWKDCRFTMFDLILVR